MKHFIKLFVILVLAFPCISMQAKDRQEAREEWRQENPNIFSMSFGISGSPRIAYSYFSSNMTSGGMLPYIYSDYRGPVLATGTIDGEFNWNISRWFNASCSLGLCPFWNDIYDGLTKEKKGRHVGMAIHIMPKAKVMWCNRPIARVYSSVALGVSLCPGFTDSSFIMPAAQFNLVGVEVGRKWFGFFELGGGSLFTGGRIGFGVKF